MQKESIPFGRAMGMKVAFCNAISVDLSEVKRLIWVSGQIALDEDGKLIGKGDIDTQTEQCIKKVEAALKKLGASLDDVVQVTVFVKEMSGLKTIHEVRLRYFKEPYPTSTLVEVKGFVNPDALIEINALAAV
jgi:enamine deaminase RidA (YjgF/YER057c/UK114 family)